MRQPFRPLFVVPGTVFTASGMADWYGNTMQSLIGGLAAQAAAAGGRRSSAGHCAAALSRQTSRPSKSFTAFAGGGIQAAIMTAIGKGMILGDVLVGAGFNPPF